MPIASISSKLEEEYFVVIALTADWQLGLEADYKSLYFK